MTPLLSHSKLVHCLYMWWNLNQRLIHSQYSYHEFVHHSSSTLLIFLHDLQFADRPQLSLSPLSSLCISLKQASNCSLSLSVSISNIENHIYLWFLNHDRSNAGKMFNCLPRNLLTKLAHIQPMESRMQTKN